VGGQAGRACWGAVARGVTSRRPPYPPPPQPPHRSLCHPVMQRSAPNHHHGRGSCSILLPPRYCSAPGHQPRRLAALDAPAAAGAARLRPLPACGCCAPKVSSLAAPAWTPPAAALLLLPPLVAGASAGSSGAVAGASPVPPPPPAAAAAAAGTAAAGAASSPTGSVARRVWAPAASRWHSSKAAPVGLAAGGSS
jgi:hypothetical protein